MKWLTQKKKAGGGGGGGNKNETGGDKKEGRGCYINGIHRKIRTAGACAA